MSHSRTSLESGGYRVNDSPHHQTNKTDRAEKTQRSERGERKDRAERADWSEKNERSDRPEKDRSDRHGLRPIAASTSTPLFKKKPLGEVNSQQQVCSPNIFLNDNFWNVILCGNSQYNNLSDVPVF